jgi:carbonic anhydrase
MADPLSRRRFLTTGVAALVAGQTATAVVVADPAVAAPAPDQALQMLLNGNQRWVTGTLEHPHQSIARREELRHAQHPYATVFSCVDARLPPEIVFDTGIGDLAVTRTGAQVLYHAALDEPGDQLDNTIRAQTKLTVERLCRDRLLKELIQRRELAIAGAYYSLDTGAVSIIA